MMNPAVMNDLITASPHAKDWLKVVLTDHLPSSIVYNFGRVCLSVCLSLCISVSSHADSITLYRNCRTVTLMTVLHVS